MKQIKHKFVFGILLILSLFFTAIGIVFANELNDLSKKEVYKILATFCQAEFDHNIDNRYDLIKMSLAYQNRLEKLTGTSIGTLYIPDAYEIYAIKSYKILDLALENNKATATVSYDVLAKRTGWKQHEHNHIHWGEAIFVEYLKPNYIEKIHLTYDGKRWWVLDPPFPKISIEKIIAFLEDDMSVLEKHNPKIKIGQALPGPQDGYNEDQRNVTLLKKLAGS